MGAVRGLCFREVFPIFYRNLLPARISKNLDDLLCPPVTVRNCNAFGGKRIAANLQSLYLPEEAADQMTTAPAARLGFSETQKMKERRFWYRENRFPKNWNRKLAMWLLYRDNQDAMSATIGMRRRG